jgi:hypothetical protein
MRHLFLLLLPALVWAQDIVNTPAIVFDSAAVTSCTSRKAVSGSVSYCDEDGVIQTITGVKSFTGTLAAGADASAGVLYVYPATTGHGKISIAAADTGGAYTLTITNATLAASPGVRPVLDA